MFDELPSHTEREQEWSSFISLDAPIMTWYVFSRNDTQAAMKLASMPTVPADSFYSEEKNQKWVYV